VSENLVAKASVTIDATRDAVWRALTDSATVERFMFGAKVASDWREGSPITWRGEWQGRRYEDKGTVLEARPGRRLRYTHFSPLSGLPDVPESYHTVTIELSGDGPRTEVTLTQDKCPGEQARKEYEKNWSAMLSALEKVVGRAE
jgi:uncharacterized protein YndB with AHSA1/START domain